MPFLPQIPQRIRTMPVVDENWFTIAFFEELFTRFLIFIARYLLVILSLLPAAAGFQATGTY